MLGSFYVGTSNRSRTGFMSLRSGNLFDYSIDCKGENLEDFGSFVQVDACSLEMADPSVDKQTNQASLYANQVLSSDHVSTEPRSIDEDKRARKRLNDCNYRRNKKAKLEKLEEDSKQLQGLKNEVQQLRLEKDEVSKQCQEQKERSEKLIAENEELNERIRQLQSNGMLPSGHLQRRQMCNHHNFELESNEVSFLPFSIPDKCYSDALVAEFIAKLDEDVKSNVETLDFTGLDGGCKKVGIYNFPLSLVPTAEMITKAYGDVTANSLLNRNIVENAYILFCASIKEMNELPLERVTESRMLKWKDTIKDAMRINLNVSFAMEHLKKIAQAYFGLKAVNEQWNIDKQITKLENKLYVLWQENEKTIQELNAWIEKKARKEALKSEQYEACMAAAEDFKGKTVGSGLLWF